MPFLSTVQLRNKLSATVLKAFAQQMVQRRNRHAIQNHSGACMMLEPRILLSAVLDTEPNDTIDTAGDFGVIDGQPLQTVNGTLSSSDRVDLYQFTITQNKQVSIQLSGLTADTILQLYGDFDQDLYLSTSYEQLESITLNSSGSLNEALSAGKYFIRIENRSSAQQSYSLGVLAGQTIGTDAGRTEHVATPLIAGAAPVQDVVQINDWDFYKFTITEPSQIKIRIDGINGEGLAERIYADVAYAESNEILGSVASVYVIPPEGYLFDFPAEPGTYYVAIFSGTPEDQTDNQSDNAAYQISLETSYIPSDRDVGDSFATAATLLPGTPPVKNILQYADPDVYKFTLAETSSIAISLQGFDGNALTGRITYRLYRDFDGDGLPVYNEELSAKRVSQNEVITDALEAGTYYIWLTVYDMLESLTYQISLNTTVIPGADDAGDSYATAPLLVPGQPRVNVLQKNDVDFYKFTLSQTSSITATITSIRTITIAQSIAFELLADVDHNNTYEPLELLTRTLGNPTYGIDLNEFLEAGTYYLRVTGGGAYQIDLTTTAIPGATDAGNTLSTATTLISGAAPIINVIGANDIDVYKFTLTAASNINTTFQGYTRSELSEAIQVQLLQDLNGDGLPEKSEELEFLQGTYRLAFNESLEAGTYYIRILGYHNRTSSYGLSNPAYKVSLTTTPISGANDAGETLASATPLQTDGVVMSNVVQTGDVDVYKFAINRPIDVIADLRGIPGGPTSEYVQLIWGRDSNNNGVLDAGEVIVSQNILGSAQLRQNLLSAGTYFIQIKTLNNQWNNNTSYQLGVTAVEPEIVVRTSGSSSGTDLVNNVSTIDFGSPRQGKDVFTQAFVVHNDSLGRMVIDSLRVTGGEFVLESHSMPSDRIIQPRGYFTFTVRMRDNTLGPKSGVVTIISTDADEGVFTFNLTGIVEPYILYPTNITLSAYSVPENFPSGAQVGLLKSESPKANTTFTYTLVPSSTGPLDNAAFRIVGNILYANTRLIASEKSHYTVHVRTTDKDGLFYEKRLGVSLAPVTNTFHLDYGKLGYQETVGTWTNSATETGYNGSPTRYSASSMASVRWATWSLEPGWYSVEFWNTTFVNNTRYVQLTVYSARGSNSRIIDHQAQQSGRMSLGTFYLDNTSSVLLLKSGSGLLRADTVQFTRVNPPPVVIANENKAPHYQETYGNWSDSANQIGFNNSSTRYSNSTNAAVRWTYTPMTAGWYVVEFWNVAHGSNTTSATITVKHDGQTETGTFNHATSTVGWKTIGKYYFAGTSDEYIQLSKSGTGYLRADAVRFTWAYPPVLEIDNVRGQFGTPNGVWQPSALAGIRGPSLYSSSSNASAYYNFVNLSAGWYDIEVYIPAALNSAVKAKYTIASNSTTTSITIDQRPGGWITLGEFLLSQSAFLTLTNTDSGLLRADMIRLIPKIRIT